MFDLNTVYKYETLMGEQTIAENREEASFIWDNYYDRESMRNEYELAILSLREPADCTVSMRKSTISVHTRCQGLSVFWNRRGWSL